jgi:hypothetical protein
MQMQNGGFRPLFVVEESRETRGGLRSGAENKMYIFSNIMIHDSF